MTSHLPFATVYAAIMTMNSAGYMPRKQTLTPDSAAFRDLDLLLDPVQWLDRRERLPVYQMSPQHVPAGVIKRLLWRCQRLRTQMQWGPLPDVHDGPSELDLRWW